MTFLRISASDIFLGISLAYPGASASVGCNAGSAKHNKAR